MKRIESVDPWKQRQPACCVGVTVEGEAECTSGCHRIRVWAGQRIVTDRRTGSPNPVWQGRIR